MGECEFFTNNTKVDNAGIKSFNDQNSCYKMLHPVDFDLAISGMFVSHSVT